MTAESFGSDITPPSGAIAIWAGLLADIPAGWVVCDGNNGTPNLLNRFVKSVPNGTTDPGGTGGANSMTLATGQLPSHSHSGNVYSVGSHRHNYWSSDYAYSYQDENSTYLSGSGASTESVSGHSHSGSLNNTGSGSSIDNRPSFYEIAFIMKS